MPKEHDAALGGELPELNGKLMFMLVYFPNAFQTD
jgi:hypothetical protein